MSRPGQLRALQEAQQLIHTLGIDPTRPVDPFVAIDQLGLELRFDEELQELLGAVIPADPAHVLINPHRPASVQRFTAAHEIGHWVLDQDVLLSLDREEQIEGVVSTARERNAQLFAAAFLMPLDLLYETAARHDVESGVRPEATQIYDMARDMHVSFKAAVHRLADVGLVPSRERAAFLRIRPAQAKRAMLAGQAPQSPRKDLWRVDDETATVIEVFEGDELILELPENPSTGYTWAPNLTAWTVQGVGGSGETVVPDAAQLPADGVHPARPAIAVGAHRFIADDATPELVGGDGTRLVELITQQAGEWEIRMHNQRPFDPTDDPEERQFRALVRLSPFDEMRARWLADFRREDELLAHLPQP